MHPILTVLIRKPELVIEHVAGYAALIGEEASNVGGQVAKRAIAWGACIVAFLLFIVLAGVAIMLGAVNERFSWALVLVPAVPLLAAIAAFAVARRQMPEKAFSELRAQLDADAEALRAIGARS
ncbi:hypothetical protein [Ramlibacter sp.]|uniref:hypothetical protein n=1 Tax=Ramlibacter sp. TaxID=1917967 RepID=UPI003D10C869